MLIAVNTRFLIKNKLEGIGWFTYEVMKRITRAHPEHTFLFLFDRQWDPEFIFSDNIIPLKVWPPARHPYLWKYWFDHALPKIFRRYKADLFISTDGMLSMRTKVPTLLVLHDLAYIHYPEHIPSLPYKFLKKYTPLYLKKAKRIVTVSQYSKQDIVKMYNVDPQKIDVVYNGANERYRPADEKTKAAIREKYTAGTKFFIYVGSIHPRKNIKNLLLAYDAFRTEGITSYKLVIVGRKAWKTDETFAVYEAMKFKNDVIFTGHLQLNELADVLGSAEALIYPSLFEGFGIPVLEARYCGIPVICSDRTSLPEVGGDSAIYFDPESPEDIKQALIKFVANKDHWQQLSSDISGTKTQFNWDKAADVFSRSIKSLQDGLAENRRSTLHT